MSYTQGHHTQEYLRLIAEIVAKYKRRTYELMQIQPGHKVLDAGCGPGTDTIELGRIVGAAGAVVGVDHAQNQVDAADEKAREAGVAAWVTHRVADVTALPFDADTFDSARCERLFQHLKQAPQAFAEMIRVTKPAGWIVVLDTDWSTMSTDTDEIDIEQRLKRFHVERGFANGYAGRQLYRMAREQQLAQIHVEMAPTFVTDYTVARQGGMLDETEEAALAAGILTQEELDRWRRSLEAADAAGTYFASVDQILLAGQKAP